MFEEQWWNMDAIEQNLVDLVALSKPVPRRVVVVSLLRLSQHRHETPDG